MSNKDILNNEEHHCPNCGSYYTEEIDTRSYTFAVGLTIFLIIWFFSIIPIIGLLFEGLVGFAFIIALFTLIIDIGINSSIPKDKIKMRCHSCNAVYETESLEFRLKKLADSIDETAMKIEKTIKKANAIYENTENIIGNPKKTNKIELNKDKDK